MTGTRNETGLSTTTGALAGVAAVLVVVLGVFLVQRGADDAEPRAASDGSASTTSSETEPVTGGNAWVAEAKEAGKDGFPAFVPAKVPTGWTAGTATYDPDASWTFELTAPSGATVTIDQRASGTVPEVVAELIGDDAEPAGEVDLSRYGTGRWDAYESAEGQALGKTMAGTAVVVGGDATQDEVVTLTQQLLTVEMLVNHDDGSDG
jgi:hypothetical protein